jgi:hypothetical protein
MTSPVEKVAVDCVFPLSHLYPKRCQYTAAVGLIIALRDRCRLLCGVPLRSTVSSGPYRYVTMPKTPADAMHRRRGPPWCSDGSAAYYGVSWRAIFTLHRAHTACCMLHVACFLACCMLHVADRVAFGSLLLHCRKPIGRPAGRCQYVQPSTATTACS